nr:MAG TPA: hypothetical protein [Caudoviricetes sp.]
MTILSRVLFFNEKLPLLIIACSSLVFPIVILSFNFKLPLELTSNQLVNGA